MAQREGVKGGTHLESEEVTDEEGCHTAPIPRREVMEGSMGISRRQHQPSLLPVLQGLGDSLQRCMEDLAISTSTGIVERQTYMNEQWTEREEKIMSNMRAGSNIADITQDFTDVSHDSVAGGIMDEDTMDLLIKGIQSVFVETSIYRKVESTLKKHRHVTISGASGEGKTSTALMLGVKYREKGYRLMLVNDIDKFKLNFAQIKRSFLIFDDIFGSVGMTADVSHLTRVLHGLQLYLENCRTGRKIVSQHVSEQKLLGYGKKIYAVFTTKTYNMECSLSKIGEEEFYFFKGPSLLDMTRKHDHRYTLDEKKSIIQKHKHSHNFDVPEDFHMIWSTENNMFGFPLTCSLYSKFHGFQKDFHRFFKEPLFYLKTELKRILDSMNAQAAALILMLLCDGYLNLHELEIKSGNKTLEKNLKTVESIVKSISRTDIARASRSFRGTFFTEGDAIGFAHSAIYDSCACILFSINPSFTLNNCSLKFLYERVQARPVKSTAIDDHLHIIYISGVYYDIIVCRLAEGIKNGNFNMTISHPILGERVVVDMLFEKLKLRKPNKLDRLLGNKKTKRETVLHNRHDGKYLLQWAMVAQSLYLVEKILSTGYRFTNEEIVNSFYSCSMCGNVLVMKHLLTTFKSLLHVDHLNQALAFAVSGNNKEGVMLLIQHGAVFSDLTFENLKGLFSTFAGEENISLCEIVVNEIVEIGHIRDCVVDIFKRFPTASFTEVCNELFELGCEENRVMLVELVIDFSDRDLIEGNHGWTKLKEALIRENYKIFNLLVTKGVKLTDNDGNNVFHYACFLGTVFILEHILQTIGINSRGQNCLTPVTFAVASGKKEVFDLLVAKGADLTVTDIYGNTVLHHACQGGNTSIVEHLLPLFDINSRGNYDWTPVMFAANSGKKEVFDLLVAKRANLTLTDKDGNTVLHHACQGGNTSIVEHLLPLFDINSRENYDWTPVMFAANSGKKEVFDMLVAKGANLSLTDKYGNTVLHYACQGGNTSIVEHLLPLFDINSRGNNDWTPVMFAANSGKKEVFDLLVAKGANLSLTDSYGGVVLHRACQGGNEVMVKLTLPLFTVNVRGEWSHTPLLKSAACGQVGVFNLLLQHGADTSLVDDGGDTILHLACEDGNLDMVKLTLPYSDINMKNNPGWTPLMVALVYGKSKVYQYLVDEGADLTVVDKAGEDVLTLARRGGCNDVIKQLSHTDQEILEIGKWTEPMKLLVFGIFDLEKYVIGSSELIQRDGFGDTLLHLACRGGNKQCVEHILPCYDINILGRYGWTPLMMAARCGHLEVFQYLVSHKADISLVSDTGEDVLTLAQRGGHGEIITCLLTLPVFKDGM